METSRTARMSLRMLTFDASVEMFRAYDFSSAAANWGSRSTLSTLEISTSATLLT